MKEKYFRECVGSQRSEQSLSEEEWAVSERSNERRKNKNRNKCGVQRRREVKKEGGLAD
jgi:hypothetical protein